MTQKGLTSPMARSAGNPVALSRIAEMLADPFYAGQVVWNGVCYPGQHKPLVSQGLFDQVQQVLRAHNKAGTRQRRHDHYLKGLLYCAGCHNRLSLTLAKGTYLYYYCLGQKNSLKHKTGCQQPYVIALDAERGVEDLYRRIQLPPTWVDKLRHEMRQEVVERQSEGGQLRVELTKRLATLADERQKLLRAYYANAIPLELLKADQDRITAQESAAKAELARTDQDLSEWQEVIRLAINLAGNCHQAYLKANPKVRHRFNEAVLQSVYIKDSKVTRAEFNDPFKVLFFAQVRISV